MRSLGRPPRIDWPPSASGRHAIANTERLALGPAHFADPFHSPSRGAIPSRRPTSHTPGPFVSGAAPTPSRGSARASVIRLGELARSEPIASMNDRSDRRSLPSSFHRRGAVASMLGERSIPFGDEGLQPFERWMAGRTASEIVMDLFDPFARDAPRLSRRRHNPQRLRDRSFDNPIDHVGHREFPDTKSSPKRRRNGGADCEPDILHNALASHPSCDFGGIFASPRRSEDIRPRPRVLPTRRYAVTFFVTEIVTAPARPVQAKTSR